jgi:hypothetical protein
MFNSLAQARKQRMVNAFHNQLIRESVLDLVEDDGTGEIGIDSSPLLMDPETDIPDDVLDSVEARVDEVIAGLDISNMTEEELDAVADQIIAGLNTTSSEN